MRKPSQTQPDFPWWLIIVGVAAGYFFWHVATNDRFSPIFGVMAKGIWVTIWVTLVSYLMACALGLILALGQLSRWLVWRQLARLYVEVMRGIPILVLLLYIAFALVPALVAGWNWVVQLHWIRLYLGWPEISGRDIPFVWRAVMALTLAYASFLAEVFRAGLMAVDQGQIEAAEALGLSGRQRFRLVVFPQAFRTILPPLGNDFVAMIKDSSLVSVVGVADITQLGKVWAAGNFRYLDTYNVMALIYLTMTICLSLALRQLEGRMRGRERR